MAPDDFSLNAQLTEAQAYAVLQKLPFAVVYCLVKTAGKTWPDYEAVLEKLATVESILATYVIPLMLIIGKSHNELEGVFHHLQPKRVFYGETGEATSANSLTIHPFAWPGAVQKVSALKNIAKAYITEDTPAC